MVITHSRDFRTNLGSLLLLCAIGCSSETDEGATALGGAPTGTGGAQGPVSSAGGATGSTVPTGGTSQSGISTGGTSSATAPTGGTSSGGTSANTAPTGGTSTGGTSSHLTSTGGTSTGGTSAHTTATGGTSTGGTSSHLTATGGTSTGGTSSHLTATGGTATGGTTQGGSSTGGTSTGGNAGASGGPEEFVSGKAPTAAAYFKRGINLGNRLEAPNEGEWGGTILASDFPFIAARGFDHVRIPVCFSCHAATGAPFTIDAAFFTRVDTVIEQALAAKLAVIIDLHAYDALAADVSGHRARLVALWKQIAERYRAQPDKVAFELVNEPYKQLDTTWNSVLAEVISAIRPTNPRRLLVVDTVYWADPSRLTSLELPNDANIMVAIHLYEPKLFSFQGQSWMGAEYQTTGVLFPGPSTTPIVPVQAARDASWAAQWFNDYNSKPAATNPSGPATIDAQVALITSYRSAKGRTVYNGEWGPQDGGDDNSRANLITAVRARCESAGIPWAIWEDPKNMSLFDSKAGTWNTKLVDALLPR